MSRRKTVKRQALECAKIVNRTVKHKTGVNWRYEAKYFGTALKQHLANAAAGGMVMDDKHREVFQRAMKALQTHCDGQDCTFKRVGGQ